MPDEMQGPIDDLLSIKDFVAKYGKVIRFLANNKHQIMDALTEVEKVGARLQYLIGSIPKE